MEIINKIPCVLMKIHMEELLVKPEVAIEAKIKDLQRQVGCKLYFQDYYYNPESMTFILRLIKEDDKSCLTKYWKLY